MILISTVTSSNPGHYVMLTLEQNPTEKSSGFISKSLDKWANEHGVTMDFSQPGKPTYNPFIESLTALCVMSV